MKKKINTHDIVLIIITLLSKIQYIQRFGLKIFFKLIVMTIGRIHINIPMQMGTKKNCIPTKWQVYFFVQHSTIYYDYLIIIIKNYKEKYQWIQKVYGNPEKHR